MEEVVTDDGERRRRGERARERVEQLFSVNAMRTASERLYAALESEQG
jgi:hypothetical protein